MEPDGGIYRPAHTHAARRTCNAQTQTEELPARPIDLEVVEEIVPAGVIGLVLGVAHQRQALAVGLLRVQPEAQDVIPAPVMRDGSVAQRRSALRDPHAAGLAFARVRVIENDAR